VDIKRLLSYASHKEVLLPSNMLSRKRLKLKKITIDHALAAV
jgi:hypothetical protein